MFVSQEVVGSAQVKIDSVESTGLEEGKRQTEERQKILPSPHKLHVSSVPGLISGPRLVAKGGKGF